MALYLGNQRVTPSLNTIIEKVITVTQDASGNTISTSETQNPGTSSTFEDPDNLSADLPVLSAEWTRPTEWPNLDDLPDLTEGVYLTYDNIQTDCKYASFYCTMNTGSYRVAQGHIDGSGNWVQDAYWDTASGNYKEINFSGASTDYVVFKVIPVSTNHFTSFFFGRIGAANMGNTIAARQCQDQYCIERRGRLPYLITLAGSGSNYRFSTFFMQADNTLIGENVTGTMNLATGYYQARRLRKIKIDNWPTAQWNVTNIASLFDSCHSLEKIDLSSWNTANWHVTSMSELFRNCYKAKEILAPFNTVNWGNGAGRTISFANLFICCYSVERLDLSMWDVSGLNVTSLASTWNSCYHLKSLKISNWNTSNWVLTNLSYTWASCHVLVDIDLSNWVTSNWKVTTLASTWGTNYKRRNFNDIKNWNTSLWAVTTMTNTFDSCFKIQELDLRNWDTSNWKVTSLYYTWNSCRSMRSLKVGNWDTSQWTVTNLQNTWCSCYNLEDQTFFNWDTSNWAVTTMYQTFYYCQKFEEVDLTQWSGASSWALTSIAYMLGYNKSLKKVNISNLNLTNVPLDNYGSNATTYTIVYECFNLEELKLPATFKGHLNLRYCWCMPRTEIVRIFNALPNALTNAKINIIDIKYKLTSADVAIASGKGYNVIQS